MRWIKKLFYYVFSVVEMLVYFKNWPKVFPLFLRNDNTKEHILKLRHPPLQIAVRGAMDVWSVKETFLDAFYTRYGVPIRDGWRIIDIGAGIGDFSMAAAFGRPHAVIYAYEPFKDSYQMMMKNLVLNGIDNVFAFQRAVWSHSGDVRLDISAGEPLQIGSQYSYLDESGSETITVQALSLQAVIEQNDLTAVDLLKLDCEGAEYEILMGTPPATLKKVDRIIMEYHDIDLKKDHQNLILFLEEAGYCVTRHENFVHNHIGYLFAARQ